METERQKIVERIKSESRDERPRELRLAQWTRSNKWSALQEMLIASARPDLISFSVGLPAAELFPTREFAKAVDRVLATDPHALQYRPPYQPLKQHVVRLMALRGVRCSEEQVFLTSGAQQGINLLVRLLLDPGESVVLEERAYTGFQQVLKPYQPRMATVGTDVETGMDVEHLERVLSRGPKPALIYAVADGHNPTAVSMSADKRNRLVELARMHGTPIIEDDPYGMFEYGKDQSPPPLRALDDEWVFYVGTFSKVMAPALRTGWIVVPESLVKHLAVIKEAADIDMAPLNQRAISAYLDSTDVEARLNRLRTEYRRRRDAMLKALAINFPSQSRWEIPSAGFFIWVRLPDGIDSGELLKTAMESEKVAFIPGHSFDVDQALCEGDGGKNCIRLSFSNSTVEQIEEGIGRLGLCIKNTIGRTSGAV